jgi:hypothetical protein
MELSAFYLDRAVARDLAQQADQLSRAPRLHADTHVTLNLLTAWS